MHHHRHGQGQRLPQKQQQISVLGSVHIYRGRRGSEQRSPCRQAVQDVSVHPVQEGTAQEHCWLARGIRTALQDPPLRWAKIRLFQKAGLHVRAGQGKESRLGWRCCSAVQCVQPRCLQLLSARSVQPPGGRRMRRRYA